MEPQENELMEIEANDELEEVEVDFLSILFGTVAGVGLAVVGYKAAEFATFQLRKRMYQSKGIEFKRGDQIFKIASTDDVEGGYLRINAQDGVIDYILTNEKVKEGEEPA